MTEEKKKWSLRPGDPTKPGVTRTADGYNFTIEPKSGEPLELLFFRSGKEEPEQILLIPQEYRTGTVISVVVKKTGLMAFEYCYRQEGKEFVDPCAGILKGKGSFGEKEAADRPLRGGILKENPPASLEHFIPYENMIVYKVHVRGYTRQKNSRVRKKGTFQGLQEKIPYWKELGITSLELMPAYEFQEYPPKNEKRSKYDGPEAAVKRVNYWGYAPGDYFAPKTSYCAGKHPEQEMKNFISALHRAGMECLMDFYFPGEIPAVLVLEVLRFWRMEYRIDGFVLLGEGAWIELLAQDGILTDTKLICPGYDMTRLYGSQGPGIRRMGEANSAFQDMMRRLLKGDEDQLNSFLYYNRRNPSTHGVINYIANHDGFTLADLFSYDYRHNEENGEDNRDGTAYNYSWNCGAEGPTRKLSIQETRIRLMKNALMLVFLSQGTPLLYGGDELGNTQNGNNNAYCQDNEIGWVDWSRTKKYTGLTAFVRNLIRFRMEHPILHMPCELRPTDYKSLGWPELSYHSERAWFSNTQSSSREVGILYCGRYAEKMCGVPDDFIYIVYNMHWASHDFALPDLPEGMKWYLAVDSGRKAEEAVLLTGTEEPLREKKSLKVEARRIMVLIGK